MTKKDEKLKRAQRVVAGGAKTSEVGKKTGNKKLEKRGSFHSKRGAKLMKKATKK